MRRNWRKIENARKNYKQFRIILSKMGFTIREIFQKKLRPIIGSKICINGWQIRIKMKFSRIKLQKTLKKKQKKKVLLNFRKN